MPTPYVFLLVGFLGTLIFKMSMTAIDERQWMQHYASRAARYNQQANEIHSLSAENRLMLREFALDDWKNAVGQFISLALSVLIIFLFAIPFLYLLHALVFKTNW